MAEKDLLRQIREKRAKLEVDTTEAEELFKDLEDIDEEMIGQEQVIVVKEGLQRARTKLDEAKVKSTQAQQDIHDLMRSLRQRYEAIGALKEHLKDYEGFTENWYAFWGKFGFKSAREIADKLRRQRQDTQTITHDLKELVDLNAQTTLEIGKIEKRNINVYVTFTNKYKQLLKLLEKRVPEHESIKAEIQVLAGQIELVHTELETAETTERVKKEQELEGLEKDLQAKQVHAAALLEKIKTWQEAIPMLRQVREDVQKSIQAFRQMRVGLKELERSFKVVLEEAMTAVKNINVVEQYDIIVPVVKEAVSKVLSIFNEAAIAGMDRAAAHSASPIMDPDEQLRQATELKEAVDKYFDVMNEIAEREKKGPRYPKVPVGGNPDSDGGSGHDPLDDEEKD